MRAMQACCPNQAPSIGISSSRVLRAAAPLIDAYSAHVMNIRRKNAKPRLNILP